MATIGGLPGTFSGLYLRVFQLAFALASLALMSVTDHYIKMFTSFQLLAMMMSLVVAWSICCILMDVAALKAHFVTTRKQFLASVGFSSWVLGMVVLGGVCASAAVITFYIVDFPSHWSGKSHMVYTSVAFGFIASFLLLFGAHRTLWELFRADH